jgi:HD-GYP domain-containing protein (c-di-GMP phosphodiesterase class II)
LGEGLPVKSLLQGKIIYIEDLNRDGYSYLRQSLLGGEGFITYYAVPLVAKGEFKGVLELFHRSTHRATQDWMDFLQSLAAQAAIAIDNAALFDHLQRANLELSLAYDATIEGWSRALELRDRETQGHALRVVELSMRLARRLGIPEKEMVHVRRGVLLHDIGKMGIPDSILLKPGPLNEEEWVVMRRHPEYAYNLLAPIRHLTPALDIPYCHHERWNGSGYPRGLNGVQIPLTARMFAVVDIWDALLSYRPYRDAWPRERVEAYLREQAGKTLDPEVVEVFLKMVYEEEGKLN